MKSKHPKSQAAGQQIEFSAMLGAVRFVAAALRPLTTEAVVEIGAAGMWATVVNPSHTGMAGVRLNDGADQVFEFDDSGIVRWGVDLDALAAACRGQPYDVVTIEGPRRFVASAQLAMSGPSFVRRFPMINLDGITVPKVPEIQPETRIAVERASLVSALLVGGSTADEVVLRVRDRRLGVFIEGDRAGMTRAFRHLPDGGPAPADTPGSMYPMYELRSMLSAVRAESVALEFGADMPLRLSMWNAYGRAWYLLAPRVDDKPEPGEAAPPSEPKEVVWPPDDAGASMSDAW